MALLFFSRTLPKPAPSLIPSRVRISIWTGASPTMWYTPGSLGILEAYGSGGYLFCGQERSGRVWHAAVGWQHGSRRRRGRRRRRVGLGRIEKILDTVSLTPLFRSSISSSGLRSKALAFFLILVITSSSVSAGLAKLDHVFNCQREAVRARLCIRRKRATYNDQGNRIAIGRKLWRAIILSKSRLDHIETSCKRIRGRVR